ncbi:MAG: hypothetical protein CVV27_12950 [Candidatus Melainabacteria bacterium HGW-Melainabacteria-1]|nr:MAG: hypothetical protein CVV27_12950 [Candidatus Melainabacteria bacterium HGW-Melainabacteria-1]
MRPAPPITLPPEADEVLVEMVVRAFYQQSQKNLRQAPAEIQRLYQRAIDWRQTLEQRYAVAALAEKLLGQYTLQLLITREALLTEVDQRLEGRELPWRPSHRCPICQASMQAARHCGQCGFHLEDPQWQQRREKLSAESGSELIPGQILLALPQVGQVLLLNAWHEVISEYELSPIGLKNPCHALALPNRNYLICDARAKRVIELSPGGHLVRELKYPFTQPVLATFYATDTDSHRLLVVDRGAHSVLEFSFEGELNCRWGPKEGLDLKYPQDVQRSWNDTLLITDTGQRRVIEIERSGRILASWGPPGQPLQRPVLARREVNGDTLIVDAGRGQLTAFNEARQLVRNFSYWPPPALDGKLKDEPAPDRLLVLGRELLALSPNYWMQIAVHLEQIRWVKPWTGERKRQRLLRIGDASGESGTVALLRRVPFLKQAKREVLELLAEHLKPLGCEAGAMLLHQDELGSDMFFLAEGEVEVLKQGSDKPVATLGPGNLFGEVALILSEPRSASVRAKVNCRLLQLERKDFQQVVTSFPEFAEHLRRLALERKALTHGQRSQQQQEVLRRVKTRMAINKLRPLAFFTDASEPLLEALADAMRPVAFMPNHIFFSSGESGETMFFITRGQVFVSLADSTQPVATLQAGDVFGEMALLLDQPRSATVRGDSYCQCYALDRGTFEHIAGQHPAFFERLQKLAAQRKALNQDISSRLQAEAEAAQAAAAELQAAYAEAAAELDAALAGAEVIGSAPLMVVHLLSPVSEQILALDGEGQILRRMGQELGLFHPYRLHAQADTLWVTDTGNDRVLALDTDSGRLLREWGNHLLPLAQPRSAVPTPDGNLLIADEGNQRLVLAGPQGNFFWEYTTPHEIMSPYYAEQTPTGTFLFCDTALHMVIEIDPRNKEVIWSYGQLLIAGDGPDELSEPSCVRRLPLGGTLIADTGNDRLLLLSPQGKLMRAFVGSPEIPLIQPVQCEMLPSGEVLVWSGARAEIVRLNLAGDPVWRARMPAERVGA